MLKLFISALLLTSGIHFIFGIDPNETKDWLIFNPDKTFNQSEIDASELLDKPAGKHGFLKKNGPDLVFEDGTKVKLWGVNICSELPYSTKEIADQWVSYLIKYGVNAVRFHKFTWHGYENEPSASDIRADKYPNFDYFSANLKKAGIYTAWSHIYGHRPGQADSSKMLAYSEIRQAGSAHLKGSTIGLVNFAPDLQDLSIELTVNMLNHRNPFTGLRYADDPSLAYIELQNEDNIFFYTTSKWVEACPTYKKLFCKQFSQWLKKKYGTQEKLIESWGKLSLNAWSECFPEENIENGTMYPQSNLWFYTNVGLAKMDTFLKKRIFDTGIFLFEKQVEFYQKFSKAIWATGYKGEIIGSCWQAGDNINHYYNLRADYETGMIDRHNYFGGGAGGHSLKTGLVNDNNTAMVTNPGSGLLGTGAQMVIDRPFNISEWMSLTPNQWIAEATPIIAIYGMGLQGWDASFSFASNQPGLYNRLTGKGINIYNTDAPHMIGLYPVLSRMVHRGDVTEGTLMALRKIHLPSLAEGKLGFNDQVQQNQDIKTFSGVIPPEALAIGKVAVAFVDSFENTLPPVLGLFWDQKLMTIKSNTGELNWNYSNKGYFSCNTVRSKALVGFAPNISIDFGEIKITTTNQFAVILITSLDNKSISQSEKLLLITMARVSNSNMEYNSTGTEVLNVGNDPLLIEPVSMKISFTNPKSGKVQFLDHSGNITGKFKEFDSGQIALDGKQTQTFYYTLEIK